MNIPRSIDLAKLKVQGGQSRETKLGSPGCIYLEIGAVGGIEKASNVVDAIETELGKDVRKLRSCLLLGKHFFLLIDPFTDTCRSNPMRDETLPSQSVTRPDGMDEVVIWVGHGPLFFK